MKVSVRTDRLERELQEIIDGYRRDGAFSHAYYAAGQFATGRQLDGAVGDDDRDVFDLSSLTKALVTTPLVFKEVLDRGLKIDASLNELVDGEKSADLDGRLMNLRIQDILRHESGLPFWRNFWVGTQSQSIDWRPGAVNGTLVRRLNLAADQIERNQGEVYSDLGFLLLGLLFERSRGESLSEQFTALQKHVDANCTIGNLGFYNKIRMIQKRAISTGYCRLRERLLIGEVHDENCAALGGICGHAGLFGRGSDLIYFLKKLLSSEIGDQLFEANRMRLSSPPNAALMGWRQGGDESAATFARGFGMGHMGFTGVAFWVAEDRRFSVLLTNRVASGRMRKGIAAVRANVFRLLDQLSDGLGRGG